MAIKNIIARGIGFSPGSTAFIPTRGFTSAAVSSSLDCYVDNFAINTSTGNQSITGVGFEPKIVIFYGTHLTADGVVVHNAFACGAGISSTSRFCITSASEDNKTTSDAVGSNAGPP